MNMNGVDVKLSVCAPPSCYKCVVIHWVFGLATSHISLNLLIQLCCARHLHIIYISEKIAYILYPNQSILNIVINMTRIPSNDPDSLSHDDYEVIAHPSPATPATPAQSSPPDPVFPAVPTTKITTTTPAPQPSTPDPVFPEVPTTTKVTATPTVAVVVSSPPQQTGKSSVHSSLN